MNGLQVREAWLSYALQNIDQLSKTIEDLQKQIAELQKQLQERPPKDPEN